MDSTYSQSLRRLIVRVYHIQDNLVINLALMLEENESDGNVSMSLKYNNLIFETEGKDLYSAFQRLKDRLLEEESLGLQCYGSMLNVHPSNTMRDMSKAYLLVLQQPVTYNDAVDILKYIDIKDFATSLQQDEFYAKWLESVK